MNTFWSPWLHISPWVSLARIMNVQIFRPICSLDPQPVNYHDIYYFRIYLETWHLFIYQSTITYRTSKTCVFRVLGVSSRSKTWKERNLRMNKNWSQWNINLRLQLNSWNRSTILRLLRWVPVACTCSIPMDFSSHDTSWSIFCYFLDQNALLC